MKTYDIIDGVTLPIPDMPIGISVSGGADSALLLYFLLKYTNNTLHIFSLASQQKRLTTTKAAIDVISRCAELTGNYNFVHHIKYATEQTKENLFSIPRLFLQNSTIKFMYTGVTKNPPLQITDGFNNSNTEHEERNPNVKRNIQNGDFFAPWTNIDKKDICKIYEKYNLINSLYLHTRSCEWTIDMGGVPDPHNGHCGVCWWCEEREWGFGKL